MNDQKCDHEQLYLEIPVKFFVPIQHNSAREVSRARDQLVTLLEKDDPLMDFKIGSTCEVRTPQLKVVPDLKDSYKVYIGQKHLATIDWLDEFQYWRTFLPWTKAPVLYRQFAHAVQRIALKYLANETD